MEARIPPLEAPYDPEIEAILARMMGGSAPEPLRLFRVVAHNKAILDKLRSTGSYLLNFGAIDPLEREIVIHRTCARCGSEYEWGVHVFVYGRPLGLTDEQIYATAHGSASDPVWSERERLLVRLADELFETNTISGELVLELTTRWSSAQIVELVALAGQYRMVSYFTNAFDIAPEEFAARFPPKRELDPRNIAAPE